MTTVVAALNRAARQCSVSPPSAWTTATDNQSMEIKDFLEETAFDILDRIDLPAPVSAQFTITGDGSETYALPAGLRRIQRDDHAVFETSNQRRPLIPVTSDGQWTHIKEIGSTGADRFYRVTGYEGAFSILIFEAPSAGDQIVVSYNTSNWKATAGGVAGDTFENEDDILLLPRRIVEAGIIWRFRERKGLPYLDRYNDYEAQLGRLSNDRRSRRVIDMSGSTSQRRPWDVPVPDFIPAS
jgi:hypothetical protein